jgi:hypothetical protein
MRHHKAVADTRHPHQAGVPWGTGGVRQRNWGTPAQHFLKTATPPPATWPAGVLGRLHLDSPGRLHPDLAMSRRCSTSGRDALLVTYRLPEPQPIASYGHCQGGPLSGRDARHLWYQEEQTDLVDSSIPLLGSARTSL